jgi:hypothetical protein
MKLPIALPLTLVLAAAGSMGCSSNSPSASNSTVDSGGGGGPDTTPSDDAGIPAVDAGKLGFSTDIYTPIIEKHCAGCHGYSADGGAGTGIAFGKLDLSSVDAGYENLVNAPAAGEACADIDGSAGPLRVDPGSADTSLLYIKVNGFTTAPPCGGPMPKSGEIPDGGQAVVVQQIETWINQGALP